MPEYIPKKKNINFDNSSNKSNLSSISKFSKSSDNLEYYQNMANSSLKVSQLQKIQDTANKNVLQRVVPDNAVIDQTILESNQAKADVLEPDERILNPVESFLSSEYIEEHLDAFDKKGAGKFDHPEGFKKIGKEYDWGRGLGQFFGRLDEQREVADKAKNENGLWTISEELAVPPMYFVDKNVIKTENEKLESQGGSKLDTKEQIDNPNNEIILQEIPNPKELEDQINNEFKGTNILNEGKEDQTNQENFKKNIPSGKESGAYKGEFKFGGETKAGQKEVVITPLAKKLFNKVLGDKIHIRKLKYPQTPGGPGEVEDDYITKEVKDENDK